MSLWAEIYKGHIVIVWFKFPASFIEDAKKLWKIPQFVGIKKSPVFLKVRIQDPVLVL